MQRQHCIKLELEKAMDEARAMMAQLDRATQVRGGEASNLTGLLQVRGGGGRAPTWGDAGQRIVGRSPTYPTQSIESQPTHWHCCYLLDGHTYIHTLLFACRQPVPRLQRGAQCQCSHLHTSTPPHSCRPAPWFSAPEGGPKQVVCYSWWPRLTLRLRCVRGEWGGGIWGNFSIMRRVRPTVGHRGGRPYPGA